jgi:hypothetical protein
MAFPFCHEFSGQMQAPFGLDHGTLGEAVLTVDILAEFDQIGCASHRAHHFVELVEPVAMPVRKLRHVALRKGRLLVGDRRQGKRWIGDDPRAVAARDLAVQFGAVGGLNAFTLDPLRGRADLALRLQCNALGFKTAVVDPRVDVELGQPLVGELGPAPAPAFHYLGAVPVAHLAAEAVLVHRPHGQHDMGMGFGHAVFGHVPMHVEIGDHAPIDELAPNEVAGELDPLGLGHLARKGEFDLAGQLRVLADLERLDIVPQPLAVAPLLRRTVRQHYLGMDHAALSGKVMAAIKPFVAQPHTSAVGG